MDVKMECVQLQTSASVIQASLKSLKEATIALDVSGDLRWLICTWSWFPKKFSKGIKKPIKNSVTRI